jgi:hypothetical protein
MKTKLKFSNTQNQIASYKKTLFNGDLVISGVIMSGSAGSSSSSSSLIIKEPFMLINTELNSSSGAVLCIKNIIPNTTTYVSPDGFPALNTVKIRQPFYNYISNSFILILYVKNGVVDTSKPNQGLFIVTDCNDETINISGISNQTIVYTDSDVINYQISQVSINLLDNSNKWSTISSNLVYKSLIYNNYNIPTIYTIEPTGARDNWVKSGSINPNVKFTSIGSYLYTTSETAISYYTDWNTSVSYNVLNPSTPSILNDKIIFVQKDTNIITWYATPNTNQYYSIQQSNINLDFSQSNQTIRFKELIITMNNKINYYVASNNGTIWTAISASFPVSAFCVGKDGDGIDILVSVGYRGQMYSYDGVNWNNAAGVITNMEYCCYSPYRNEFMGVYIFENTVEFISSFDGKEWKKVNSNISLAAEIFRDIIWVETDKGLPVNLYYIACNTSNLYWSATCESFTKSKLLIDSDFQQIYSLFYSEIYNSFAISGYYIYHSVYEQSSLVGSGVVRTTPTNNYHLTNKKYVDLLSLSNLFLNFGGVIVQGRDNRVLGYNMGENYICGISNNAIFTNYYLMHKYKLVNITGYALTSINLNAKLITDNYIDNVILTGGGQTVITMSDANVELEPGSFSISIDDPINTTLQLVVELKRI